MSERRERNRPFSFTDLDPEDWRRAGLYEWVEPKYDGHFARLVLEGKEWTVYSSTDRVVQRGQLKRAHRYTEFWCEHIRGTEWARKPERKSLYEHLAIFASPSIAGVSMAPHDDITRDVIGQWINETDEDLVKRMFLIERVTGAKAKALWKRCVQDGDYEGLVLGGPQGLARMKARASCDYVCMGFEESDSDRYAGRGVRNVIGGLYINGKLTRLTTVGGLNDDQREEYLRNPKPYIGQVFEAEGKRLFSSGKLRHPNFLRWRSDKPATACKPPSK